MVLEKCGVNYVNRWDSQDRAISLRILEYDLSHGVNVIWFPEGTWNLSPNALVTPLSYTLTNLAKKTDTSIVPVGLERYNNTVIVNFGDSYVPSKETSSEEEALVLRDKIATLKWEIFEQYPLENRAKITDEYWGGTILRYFKEYLLDDLLDEDSYIFKPKGDAYEFFDEFNSAVSYKDGEKIVRRISSEGGYTTQR